MPPEIDDPVKAKETPKEKKGGKALPDPNWVTKHALARMLRAAPSVIQGYMALPDAPAPNKNGKYHVDEAVPFCKSKAKWAVVGQSPENQELKQRKLKLEVLAMEREEAKAAGSLVSKDEVVESLEALWLELWGMIQQKYVQELPPKYQGKNEAERRQLNEQALNEISQAFREGQKRVDPTPEQALAS